jgi:hypothetical protein
MNAVSRLRSITSGDGRQAISPPNSNPPLLIRPILSVPIRWLSFESELIERHLLAALRAAARFALYQRKSGGASASPEPIIGAR